jgi:hypothetical protein
MDSIAKRAIQPVWPPVIHMPKFMKMPKEIIPLTMAMAIPDSIFFSLRKNFSVSSCMLLFI